VISVVMGSYLKGNESIINYVLGYVSDNHTVTK